MSIHSSLGKKNTGRHRNVLKRYERIKHLKKKGLYDEQNPKYYGLPKVKCIKVTVKKTKVEKTTEAGDATGAKLGEVASEKKE